jgi:predicted dehydrogenase
MSKTLRWGVLGAANFARAHMARAIHAAERAELTALATSSAEKAAGFTAFAPGLRVHDSYDALLADPGIDAVYIPLPNSMHIEWTLKALEAGKHVLCEKPLAMRADGFDAVIAKRDETGLLAAEAYMIVHHPQWQKARELVQGGAIGKLRHVEGVFSFDNRADAGNIRNKPETGGGALPDIGVYTYGSTRFVTGEEPVEIHADLDYENGVDVYAHAHGRFESFTFSLVNSMRMTNRQHMSFHGEKGRITLTGPFNAGVFSEARLEIETTPGEVRVQRWPGVNQYVLQVENFGRTVRDGASYPCPLEFSRGTQAMIDRVYEATGK